MYSKKLLILLSIILCFNFICIPIEKSSAEALTLTYAAYCFLMAAFSAGVVVTNPITEKVTQEGMDLYNEWKNDFKKNNNGDDPEDPKFDNDWKNAIANIVGVSLIGGISNKFDSLVDNIKGFFNQLGAKEGDNIIPTYFYSDEKIVGEDYYKSFGYGTHVLKSEYGTFVSYTSKVREGDKWRYSVRVISPYGNEYNQSYLESYEVNSINILIKSFGGLMTYMCDNGVFRLPIQPLRILDNIEIDVPTPISYNIINNSYITTNNPDNKLQPSFNLNNIPDSKFNLQGEYISTPDDFIDDLVKSTPKEDIFLETPLENQVEQGPDGTIHKYNSFNPPNPDPGDNPNPDSDSFDPSVDDQTNPEDKVGFFIDYRPYFNKIIEGIKKIFDKTPDKKEDNLIIPENVQLDFSPFYNFSIKEKFPFSLPWDLQRAVTKLSSAAKAPFWELPIKDAKIFVDFSIFETLALIARSFLSLIFIVSLIILTKRII